MRALPSRRYQSSDTSERGSLLVVMSIVFVVVLLSTALITRVFGDFDNVNLETKMAQARALAQSGVADALFQIDQRGVTPSAFCNEPNSGGACPAALNGIPGAPGTVYTARYDPVKGYYTVFSQGTSRGVTYAVQATVKDLPTITNAVYGGSFISFDGNSTTSLKVTDQYGNQVYTAPGVPATANIAVGPEGTLTCNGPTDPNVVYVNFGGSISKCTPFQNLGPIYSPQEPSETCAAPPNPYGAPPTPCMPNLTTQTPPGLTQACTSMSPQVSGTDATGYTVTGPATLEPGIYSCRGGLTMTGTVNVDYAQSPVQNAGRVDIFVFPSTPTSTTSPNVDVSAATVNQCETIGSGSGVCKGGLVGDPTDLTIYAWGSGNANLAGGTADAVFWGPGMNLTMNGVATALNWTGALILGGIKADGHPSFNLNFDTRIESEAQQANWTVTNYVQTAPNFAIP